MTPESKPATILEFTDPDSSETGTITCSGLTPQSLVDLIDETLEQHGFNVTAVPFDP